MYHTTAIYQTRSARLTRSILAAGLTSAVLAATALPAEPEFALRDGDRLVFLGDSITEQRLYTTYVEAYVSTRLPEQQVRFWNVGWGGDTSWFRMRSFPDEKALFAADGDTQQKIIEESVNGPLNRDVLSFKPTVVMINFGMNDHNYEAFREDIFKAYIRSQTHLTRMLVKNQSRVVLLTPQPLESRSGDPSTDVRNQSLRRFAAGLKEVAAQEGAAFVNQFDPYMAIMRREHMKDVNACIGRGDEIHPGPVGHLLMASTILQALHAPALVSSARLDASDLQNVKVVEAKQCAVTNLQYQKDKLSFERADEALPMPVDGPAMDALKLAPVLDELDRYELTVTGLPADRYDLMIDGEFVTTLSQQELAKGWNLAVTAGPITRQAQDVLALIGSKNQVGLKLWEARIHGRKNEISGLEQQLGELEAQIAANCRPKPHRFVIKPSGGA